MALAISGGAHAATVTIDVRGPDGQPLSDAVVVVEAADSPRAPPHGTYVMEQRGIAFQPHILVVPVGATVALPNRDAVRHHVYSFSKAKKIDLKLYGKEDQRSIVFDKAGVVALGCNIHDSMSGFIYVTANPFADRANGQGRVQMTDVPAGKATVRVWSPSIRAPNNTLVQSVVILSSGFATTFTIHR
ncbi:methylamine utilization protein [Sphingomonas oligophenolica]|uniref:Methylamine utilization protein n=1 Tax=Sphingomonas oligophenolica TaxID=301154 RepID=A0A502CLG4_9SPHN|nr:methylamine utilization protein [Sphingomonas oligophenolica]